MSELCFVFDLLKHQTSKVELVFYELGLDNMFCWKIVQKSKKKGNTKKIRQTCHLKI